MKLEKYDLKFKTNNNLHLTYYAKIDNDFFHIYSSFGAFIVTCTKSDFEENVRTGYFILQNLQNWEE